MAMLDLSSTSNTRESANEMIVVIVQLVLGYPAAFFDLIAARALPATIFNLILCVLLYLVARKFPDVSSGNEAWTVDKKQRFR